MNTVCVPLFFVFYCSRIIHSRGYMILNIVRGKFKLSTKIILTLLRTRIILGVLIGELDLVAVGVDQR